MSVRRDLVGAGGQKEKTQKTTAEKLRGQKAQRGDMGWARAGFQGFWRVPFWGL